MTSLFLLNPGFARGPFSGLRAPLAALGGDAASEPWGSSLRPYDVDKKGTLVVPVRGFLTRKTPFALGWATGYDYIAQAVERGAADPDVARIVLHVDSPGGEVIGCFDTADAIHAARGAKPILAASGGNALSAAYAIASAADRVTIPRGGAAGSIGVVAMHMDTSAAMAMNGLVVTLIYSGARKVDGNPFEPLPEDVRADIQADIEQTYALFVSTVARNRGLSEDAVRATEARTMMSPRALDAGLIDEVASFRNATAAFAAARPDSEPDNEESMMTDHQNPPPKNTGSKPTEAYTAADLRAATEAGRAQGVAAERARISSILGSEEAKTRPVAAQVFAMKTDMPVDAAKAALADMPVESKAGMRGERTDPFTRAMDAGAHPDVGAGAAPADAEPGSDEAVVAHIFGSAGY